jgi:hypothetical protein
VAQGIVPGPAAAFVLDQATADSLGFSPEERSLLLPFYAPRDIGRGAATWRGWWLLNLTPETCPDITAFPAVEKHLSRFMPRLESRRETRLGKRAWFHLHWPRGRAVIEGPRIAVPRMQAGPFRAALLTDRAAVDLGCNVILCGSQGQLERLLAWLLSPAGEAAVREIAGRKGDVLQIDGGTLLTILSAIKE